MSLIARSSLTRTHARTHSLSIKVLEDEDEAAAEAAAHAAALGSAVPKQPSAASVADNKPRKMLIEEIADDAEVAPLSVSVGVADVSTRPRKNKMLIEEVSERGSSPALVPTSSVHFEDVTPTSAGADLAAAAQPTLVEEIPQEDTRPAALIQEVVDDDEIPEEIVGGDAKKWYSVGDGAAAAAAAAPALERLGGDDDGEVPDLEQVDLLTGTVTSTVSGGADSAGEPQASEVLRRPLIEMIGGDDDDGLD